VNSGVFEPWENKALPADLEPIPELGITVGDLLISRANTRDLVGRAAVADRNYPRLLLCDKLFRIRFIEGICSPEFIALYLRTEAARAEIELSATGASSSMLNIGQSAIRELAIALPPLSEQGAILSAVRVAASRLETLTSEARRAIDLLKERRSALISAAVTGKIDVRGLVGAVAA
jgi:type I restriction enzyme S subunit